MLAVVFSVSLFSCGNGEKGTKCDSDSCAKDSVEAPVAPVENDTTVVTDTVVATDTTVVAE